VVLIAGTRVSSRTRGRVDLSMVLSVAKAAEQQASAVSSDKTITDLTATQADAQSKAPAEKVPVPDLAEEEKIPGPSAPSASKKRKAEYVEVGDDSDDEANFYAIGDRHIAEFAVSSKNKRLQYSSRDLNRTGLGQIFDVSIPLLHSLNCTGLASLFLILMFSDLLLIVTGFQDAGSWSLWA